jgi:DNA-binding CsgD family transcriptional regulator
VKLARRRRAVVQMIARGVSRKEIAIELGIKKSTVDRHVYLAMTQNGANSVAHLVAEAMRAGLIE